VKVIGLTGGIGSGKSTVSELLLERDAVIVDADRIARELQEPGQPVFVQMVETFGDGIVGGDGRLDRQAVADIVFTDPEQLGRLMRITQPMIEGTIYLRILEHEGTDAVVILDIALLQQPHQYGEQATIVVDTPVDVAVARLVSARGMSEDDARARIARQITREQRLAIADFVIDNSGPPDALPPQVAKAWDWIASLPPRGA
jgi:dephospho-CoA kinase